MNKPPNITAITVAELLRWGRARVGGEAEVLLSFVTGRSGAGLVAGDSGEVGREEVRRFEGLVERRVRGEPVAYLCGRKEFWSLALDVNPDVLIPRPETELLVERVLAHAAGNGIATLLELGTGSGAIALALASELPGCAIVATDISPAAIDVAVGNRRRLAVEHPGLGAVEFCVGDWFEAVSGLGSRFDLIVSNPPYVAPGDAHLRRGDLRFEPRAALVSPRNGLAALEAIIAAAPRYLNAGGMLLLEHGYEQSPAVRGLFARGGFIAIATHRDLSGHERVTGGLTPPPTSPPPPLTSAE